MEAVAKGDLDFTIDQQPYLQGLRIAKGQFTVAIFLLS
jgi:ABC-type sugar transport system substrate-binding protein